MPVGGRPRIAEIEVPSYTKGVKPVEGSELRSCVKSEVAVLDSPSPNRPYGLCGREVTQNSELSQVSSVMLGVAESIHVTYMYSLSYFYHKKGRIPGSR